MIAQRAGRPLLQWERKWRSDFRFLLSFCFGFAEPLFLLRQEKWPKEGDPTVPVPALKRRNSPAMLAVFGGCGTRPLRGLRQSSPTTPQTAALLGVTKGEPQQHTTGLLLTFALGAPWASPSSTAAFGGFGEDCLSTARFCFWAGRVPQVTRTAEQVPGATRLDAPRERDRGAPSSRVTMCACAVASRYAGTLLRAPTHPGRTSSAGNPVAKQRGCAWRVLFSAYSLLHKQKRVSRRKAKKKI